MNLSQLLSFVTGVVLVLAHILWWVFAKTEDQFVGMCIVNWLLFGCIVATISAISAQEKQ